MCQDFALHTDALYSGTMLSQVDLGGTFITRQSRTQTLPTCWLVVDVRLGSGILASARSLPPRSGIIFRPYALDDTNTRREMQGLLRTLRFIARARYHILLWSGRIVMPGLDGQHLGRQARPHPRAGITTANIHNAREAVRAKRLKVDAAFISPVFSTASHAQAKPIGLRGLHKLACTAGVPAIALGGMDSRRFVAARRCGAHGWAAISAWAKTKSPYIVG